MNKKRRFARLNAIEKTDQIQNSIRNFIKSNKNIVYGARSINAQTGILTRETNDWDAYSNNPKKSADSLQRILDKLVGGNYFYSKPAKHKGTYKVKSVGNDLKPNTYDDEEVADFSKPEKKINYVNIDGIRYRKLKDEIKAKQKSLREKEMAFRHEKDKSDLDRIRENLLIKKIFRQK